MVATHWLLLTKEIHGNAVFFIKNVTPKLFTAFKETHFCCISLGIEFYIFWKEVYNIDHRDDRQTAFLR